MRFACLLPHGGIMFSYGLLVAMGYAGAAFMLAGLGVLMLTRPAPGA